MTNTSPKRYRSNAALARATQNLAVLQLANELQKLVNQNKLFNRRDLRPADEFEILALGQIIEVLINRFPRFTSELRKLQNYVRKQLTSPEVRQAEILAKIRENEMLDIPELLEVTHYDKQTLVSDTKELVRDRRLEEVTREGKPPRRHASGHPTDRVYFRLAGPSGRTARHG
jgi:hypothetical protein